MIEPRIEQVEQVEQAQQQQRNPFRYIQRTQYRRICTATHEEQAQLLEKLRYKTYAPASLSWHLMQRLGDWGREVFPWMANRGWRF